MQTIKSIGRSDIMLKLEFIKKPLFLAFIFVGLNFGPIGIALANMLYGIVGTVLNMIPNSKLVGYKMKKQLLDFFPAFVLSVIMGGIVMLVGSINMNIYIKFILQIVTGVAAYAFLAMIFMKDTYKDAKNMLKRIIRRERQDV